jgi:hypothetical protein
MAKSMLLGKVMTIGVRPTTGPLFWPMLRKAFAFLARLIMVTIIDEAVIGPIHCQPIDGRPQARWPRLEETITGFLIILLMLNPLRLLVQ